MEEKKLEKKTIIKEWIMVIGTIVLVAVASIIAYNYGLKKSTPKDSIKVDNPSEEQTNNENVKYTSITSKEYNELDFDKLEEHYLISDLNIKIDIDKADDDFELGNKYTITFENNNKVEIDTCQILIEKLNDYLIVENYTCVSDIASFEAYDFYGDEHTIENTTGLMLYTTIGGKSNDDLYLVLDYTTDGEYAASNTTVNKDMVKKYCKTGNYLSLYLNVVESSDNLGILQYNIDDYSCDTVGN